MLRRTVAPACLLRHPPRPWPLRAHARRRLHLFEVAQRLGGKVQRHGLGAATRTDAINEQRALQVDYARGEQHRSPSPALTVDDVACDWLAYLTARVGHWDPRLRRSERTVELYEQKLRTWI